MKDEQSFNNFKSVGKLPTGKIELTLEEIENRITGIIISQKSNTSSFNIAKHIIQMLIDENILNK